MKLITQMQDELLKVFMQSSYGRAQLDVSDKPLVISFGELTLFSSRQRPSWPPSPLAIDLALFDWALLQHLELPSISSLFHFLTQYLWTYISFSYFIYLSFEICSVVLISLPVRTIHQYSHYIVFRHDLLIWAASTAWGKADQTLAFSETMQS